MYGVFYPSIQKSAGPVQTPSGEGKALVDEQGKALVDEVLGEGDKEVCEGIPSKLLLLRMSSMDP